MNPGLTGRFRLADPVSPGLVYLDDDDESRMAWIENGYGRCLFVEESPGPIGSRTFTYTLDERGGPLRRTFSERDVALRGSIALVREWMAELGGKEGR